jgi:hypothetical protein
VTKERAEVRNTQTSNAFEASAAHTAGSRIRGRRWQMRDEMRRRPDQLRLALRLSGEHLQIAALLGGSEAARDREPSNDWALVTRLQHPSRISSVSSPSKVIRSVLSVGAKR